MRAPPGRRGSVDDWAERLDDLYARFGEWLPDGWEALRGVPVLMHEMLMQKFGVAARRLPTLELHGRGGQVVKLEPRALWIIGNNGRVELKCDGRYYYIIDFAENFARPDWEVCPADRRRDREPVSRDWLRRILR